MKKLILACVVAVALSGCMFIVAGCRTVCVENDKEKGWSVTCRSNMMKSELDKKVGLSDYVIAHLLNDESDFIAEHYVNPDNVGLQFPEQKRNLIYIYLESAETTFADRANGGDFEQNVIPELTVLA